MAAFHVLAAAAALAFAQTPPADNASPPVSATSDADAPVVEELVVFARQPGPAWWKISNGTATVYVLGLPMGPTPRDLTWDQGLLHKRLQVARTVIMPPTFSAGLGDIPALLRLRAQLKSKVPLADQLPAPLFARFQGDLARVGRPEGRYEGWDATLAGQNLRFDFMDKVGLIDEAVVGQVMREARRSHAAVRAVDYKATPVLRSVMSQRSDAKSQSCFAGDLDDVETDVGRYRAAADAWARGDVRGAIDLPHGADVCKDLFLDNFIQRSNTDFAAAVAEALNAPGVSVAMAPLRRLVTRGGVIERLRAQGFQVTDPARLAD